MMFPAMNFDFVRGFPIAKSNVFGWKPPAPAPEARPKFTAAPAPPLHHLTQLLDGHCGSAGGGVKKGPAPWLNSRACGNETWRAAGKSRKSSITGGFSSQPPLIPSWNITMVLANRHWGSKRLTKNSSWPRKWIRMVQPCGHPIFGFGFVWKCGTTHKNKLFIIFCEQRNIFGCPHSQAFPFFEQTLKRSAGIPVASWGLWLATVGGRFSCVGL